MSKKIVRVITGLLAIVMILMVAVPSLTTVFADDIDEKTSQLLDQYKNLEAEHKKLEEEIKTTNNKISTEKEKRKKIKDQISVIQGQIDNLDERIELINADIEQQEVEIVNLQMQIEDNYQRFEYRLKAAQLTGTTTNWDLLFGAKSFADFLSAVETIKRMAQYDNKLISSLKLDKEALKQEQEKLEADKLEVETLKDETKEKRKELDSKYAQVQDKIDGLNDELMQSEMEKEELESDMKEMQKEIDKLYEELEFQETYVGGEFLWPSATHTKITSKYGMRYWSNGSSDFHTGIDIAGSGVYGTNILAANAGTVIFVKNTYVPGKGYGKYMIVDHGGGYSTLYAHCSSISVKVGQKVDRGEPIGKVGSTGNSTGPHIHFEIRVDGTAKDPLIWFPNAK